MVKCCAFMVGLAFLFGGIATLTIGAYSTWFYGEFRVGLIIGPICIFFGIILLYYSNKWEVEERKAKLEREKKRVEEETRKIEIAEMEKAKKEFLRKKEWEKEWKKELEETGPVFCAHCGNELTPEQNYCERCGTPKKGV
ncbi:MAG: zinc ribbon domain-containing protein [Promethearchaeota archaeon]